MSGEIDRARLLDFHAYLQLNGKVSHISFTELKDLVEDYIRVIKTRLEKEITHID